MKTATQKLFVLVITLFAFLHTNVYSTKWIVDVQNFSFSPSSLPSVFVGDTLRWVWIDGAHTTTSTTIPLSAPTWDQPLNVSNQFFEYVPIITGTYNYKCTPHEGMGMVGSFIVSPLPSISLNLKVFLEGPFNSTVMNTTLNSSGLLPLSQPYNVSPWNYTGTENVASIPNSDIVDWVLIELRETTGDASMATADKRIQLQAAFVLSDGSIVGLDGSSLITYTGTITINLFVIIWHRNHLAVLSSGALPEAGGVYTWDFSTGLSNAYLNSQKQLVTNVFGMIGGDSDASGIVLIEDLIPAWSSVAGEAGYIPVDLNLDGQASNPDKNDIWRINQGSTAPLLLKCGNPFIDVRDGQSYNTVLIGDQCWMAENLNVGDMINSTLNPQNNAITEKYCYNNTTANCDVYGGLYLWSEMMEYSIQPGIKGICPADWHIPEFSEFTTLTNYLGGETVAGGKMKESGTLHWTTPNTGATNESGFTGLPGGYIYYGEFVAGSNWAHWYSSTIDGPHAWFQGVVYINTNVYPSFGNFNFGFSVRCVKDEYINQPPSIPSNPQPSDGAINQPINTILSWSCNDPENDPLTYDVYFGTTNPPVQVLTGQTSTNFNPGNSTLNTNYYWKIVVHDNINSIESQIWSFTTESNTFTIGQNYGGGIIFYIDGSGQHGLIVSSTNLGAINNQWWNGSFVATGATGHEIGTGTSNTNSIVNIQGDGSYAAKLCYDLVLNGYSDWYLPSRLELFELMIHQNQIGGLLSGWYWSSTEYTYQMAILTHTNVQEAGEPKNMWACVRAIRSF